MIDTTVVGSPGWWAGRLAGRLLDRRDRYNMLEGYVNGTNAVPHLAARAAGQSFVRLMQLSRTNYAELVVEAVRERMQPAGFRTGSDGDTDTDTDAWRVWQANSLDADSALVHRTQLVMGDAYVIVGGIDPEIGAPLITVEDPREVISAHDPRRRRRARAALKMFDDEDAGVRRLFVYLPGEVYRATARLDVGGTGLSAFHPFDWTWENDGNAERLPAPVVPVIRFANRASVFADRVAGEFEPHLGILDRICYSVRNRLEIATLQAFRQRAVKGLPNEDEDGNPVDYSDVFAADPGALWLLPETAEMWESGQVDLTPIKEAIRDDVRDLAAVTRTPMFYLAPDAANGTAEGASLAREGLVFKVQDRITQAGESWEQVMLLAMRFAGRADLTATDMEVVWSSPERHSLSERYDAASKAQAAGVPWRTVMSSVLQFSPQEIDRMEAERVGDQLLASSLFATAQPAPQVAPIPGQVEFTEPPVQPDGGVL